MAVYMLVSRSLEATTAFIESSSVTVQLPGRFYKPCVLQGFLILFTEEKLKTRMDFACVSREPRTSPARFLLRVAGIFHETLAGHHA